MNLQRIAFIFGIILLGGSLGIQFSLKQQYVPFVEASAAIAPVDDPARIVITNAGIDAVVVPGGITDGKWILSESYAHSMKTETNAIVIYAHKREGLFLNLKQTEVGDEITLLDKRNLSTRYEVISIEDVKPTDVNAVMQENQDTLTLFTCDGMFDESRLVIKARIIR